MALTNHDRVGKMLELLRDGLSPFVERELKTCWGEKWQQDVKSALSDTRLAGLKSEPTKDVNGLLVIMDRNWKDVFAMTLGKAERSMINELLSVRHEWAHQRPFSSDNTYRALDTASRVLASISAAQADDLEKMKMELLRLRFDEQVRSEKRRSTTVAVETPAAGGLKPWREIVTPHKDVASGKYQQAEFAADLWQVHLGEGSDEYKKPAEFFRRTYLTEGLKGLLIGGLQRLNGHGGDPVVQLQTNFGGGKTHSMLALYHLFSGTAVSDLPGVDALLAEAGETSIPKVKRVVLVGNKISPGNPSVKKDGTVVRTLWGELAWQLGGKKAYARIAADDEKATNPGDVLRELFNEHGPCLILIDEWVAYARQLHAESDLPGGSFETHFTFAQALTESAKLAKQCLLVISLPASDTAVSPHTQADDIEVGGQRGREALDRLRNAVGRVEASWRPASAEEGFEIVRRRLFEPLVEKEQFVGRDTVAKAFYDVYRTQHQEFPPECRDVDYETRIKAAYPIHPEIFDRLYGDWSTLAKFQRTRGVLRLMAAVIHSLWSQNDRSPLILPSLIPIDDHRVRDELTRYLSDNWVPVIERDVDGPHSLPLRTDGEVPNLGKYSACRRVARTVYMGSAPTFKAANKGIEDRRIKLGCVMPGESPAIFGDALRRLSTAATYLYHDGARYWYSTQPTVTKLAEDRAEQLKADPESVVQELDRRVKLDVRRVGDFSRVHPLARTGGDIADDMDARLVVLGMEYPHSKDAESPALRAAATMLDSRGNSPRLYRNALVFLAMDKARLQDLDEALRRFVAWQSIVDEAETLNLDPHQRKQALTQRDNATSVVDARLPEAYQWLLVPTQTTPQQPMEWQAFRLTGQDALAVRASKKLRNDELLITGLAATRLRLELDNVPLWRGENVPIKQLVEDFARYTYLPRLRDTGVLIQAIREGLGWLTWQKETFAFSESYDEASSRYLGLRGGQNIGVSEDSLFGLLVKPDIAWKQMEADKPQSVITTGNTAVSAPSGDASTSVAPQATTVPVNPAEAPKPKRFHGTVTLDPQRVGRDAGKIAEEVIAHLTSLIGADVTVRLDIEASIPSGVPDNVVRTVTENARTLKFTSQGFEIE
ncbi:MAG TPA: AAA+ family ATPase [Verrucomicrobiales bacterium]|nr:AAA+ family ATPase [Verrucomicrobiales bacterium]